MSDIKETAEQLTVSSFGGQGALQTIPVGVSARHAHLCQNHVEVLFGEGHQLEIHKELSQPGQFAAKETVMLAGPKGVIGRVRVLGPARQLSQVEISLTDAHQLGVSPPIRDSGDIAGSSPITIIGPKGSIYLPEGLIIANRHIHMSDVDAAQFEVHDGENVTVMSLKERKVVYFDVKIRVHPNYRLEFHIDTDEANAAKLTNDDQVVMVKKIEKL